MLNEPQLAWTLYWGFHLWLVCEIGCTCAKITHTHTQTDKAADLQ